MATVAHAVDPCSLTTPGAPGLGANSDGETATASRERRRVHMAAREVSSALHDELTVLRDQVFTMQTVLNEVHSMVSKFVPIISIPVVQPVTVSGGDMPINLPTMHSDVMSSTVNPSSNVPSFDITSDGDASDTACDAGLSLADCAVQDAAHVVPHPGDSVCLNAAPLHAFARTAEHLPISDAVVPGSAHVARHPDRARPDATVRPDAAHLARNDGDLPRAVGFPLGDVPPDSDSHVALHLHGDDVQFDAAAAVALGLDPLDRSCPGDVPREASEHHRQLAIIAQFPGEDFDVYVLRVAAGVLYFHCMVGSAPSIQFGDCRTVTPDMLVQDDSLLNIVVDNRIVCVIDLGEDSDVIRFVSSEGLTVKHREDQDSMRVLVDTNATPVSEDVVTKMEKGAGSAVVPTTSRDPNVVNRSISSRKKKKRS